MFDFIEYEAWYDFFLPSIPEAIRDSQKQYKQPIHCNPFIERIKQYYRQTK